MDREFTAVERIAYFSMEIALENDIPTYSGGLGVLAGDAVASTADLGVRLVAVSLVSNRGYFRQEITVDGRQIEQEEAWEPQRHCSAVNAMIAVSIEAREVWVRAWLYVMTGRRGGRIPVILLDTDMEQNSPGDRQITHKLYGDGAEYRLKQEIVLGIGGVRMLHALGFRIRQYHMNEGHSALLALELLRRHEYPAADVMPGEVPFDIPRVRELCNFTTHTPVEAGHDRFSYDLVAHVLQEGTIEIPLLRRIAGGNELNLTELALNLSGFVNGVAKGHAMVSQRMFPQRQVHAITNGVHPNRWTSAPFRRLYDEHMPGWDDEPELLVRADTIPDERIWNAHTEAKSALIERVRRSSGVDLDHSLPILGFARRMTQYKRPSLLFADLERLREVAATWPFQIVMAGKAHPQDGSGKYEIELIHRYMRELAGAIPIVFLANYDLSTAQTLVSGADVWLNTPLRPLEASGTSGMKAAFNAVPHLSVLDGWWLEGCIEGVTGWAIGGATASDNHDDPEALLTKLRDIVLPLFHAAGAASRPWVALMKGAICKTASYFNSHRMMRRYAVEAYDR